ncbi:MAG: hypothetical protein NTW59_05330 [Candidatus Diapherotrites archaeon]|nr:hypothetical protein [Candidatus Diapherotrites archaeon]
MDSTKRIKLAKGKQRKLIGEAKNARQSNWRELAKAVGVCEGYLKNELIKEANTLNAGVYLHLCSIANKNYDKDIVCVLDKNWGRAKGGKLAAHKPKKPMLLLSTPNEGLAEFIGIMLGDGSLYTIPKRSIYQIRVFGHKIDEYDYMCGKVFSLFKNLFGIEPSICTKMGKEVVVLSKQSKNLAHTLRYFGLKTGNKKNNGASIPPWVFEKEEYLRACIRGLIDTDGCVYPKTKKHKTPTIWFSSVSPGIRVSFTKALKILGYRVSKWVSRKDSDSQSCSIGSSKEVLRYYKEIGFSNPKHELRFRKFCNAPIV